MNEAQQISEVSDIPEEETKFDDTFKSVRDICLQNGYRYEEYWVTTADGYILRLMRIPGKINNT